MVASDSPDADVNRPATPPLTEPDDSCRPRRTWVRWLVFVLFLSSATVVFFLLRDSLSLATLAAQESEWRSYYQAHPSLVLLLALLIYVLITGLSLPGAAVLSLVYAWYLGFGPALVLISFASTMGASLAFLLSRYLFRDLFRRRFNQHLMSFNSSLEQEGAFYLFTLRLIPAVPFFIINLVMGLTPMKVRTFWWVSQLGMLPGTIVYCWAGASVPSLDQLVKGGVSGIITPHLFIGFVLLGTFPLIVRKLLGYYRGRAS